MTQELLNKIDAFLKRSHRYGFVNSLTKIQPLHDSAMENLFRKMHSPEHCLTLLPPDRPLGNILRSRGMTLSSVSCPGVYLICINDLSSLTVCLNLLICEFIFTYVCITSCNFCIYV